jgi:hypothetical protein
MRCIWCGYETTTDKSAATDQVRYANKEHIFPEAVGGKRCLPQGVVCKQCNDDLGRDVDQYLKTSDISMMYQYQIVDGIPGKSRGKDDRLRKLAQKEEIKHYAWDTKIRRSSVEEITRFVNMGPCLYDDKLSRALHKCLVNSLIDEAGIKAFPVTLEPLKNYVIGVKSENEDWPFGLAYANLFDRRDFEPFCDSLVLNAAGSVVAGVLIFPSLLAIVGCTSSAITKEFLWLTARQLSKKCQAQACSDSALDVISYFKGDGLTDISGRKPVHHKMNIILVKKHKPGVPIPGKLQRLVNCAYCGQINPTGVEYEKAEVLQPSCRNTSGESNGWNVFEQEDMALIFEPIYAQYFDRHFQSYKSRGIQLDANKMDALRATWSAQAICCKGCGGYVYAQPKDYFF